MMKVATDDDHHHIVLGNINVASMELKRWVELLTNNDEKLVARFRELYETKGTVLSAIMNLRRELFAEGRGKVCPCLLWSAYDNQKWDLLRRLTEEVFLEPINPVYLQTTLKVAKKNGWDFDLVMKAHNIHKEKRIWQIICCRNLNAVEDIRYAETINK
jgi:hypothetical protein